MTRESRPSGGDRSRTRPPAGVDEPLGETLRFDEDALALKHGVLPWARGPNDAPEPTTATAAHAQA